MVRASFNPARTDKYSYDVNGYVIGSGAVGGATNEYSYTNQARTQMKLRINLRSILGTKEYDSKEVFCIKLNDLHTIVERGQNTIDNTSPAWIRTSNIVMYGDNLNFVGGANEIILGQCGNFNPNDEPDYFLFYHRGDSNYGNSQPNQFLISRLNTTGNFDSSEFFERILFPVNNNTAEKAVRKWRWNATTGGTTNPPMENKEFFITNAGVYNSQFYLMIINIPNETPTYRSGVNFPIAITGVPLDNQWTMVKGDDSIPNDNDYGIEAWFHKPKNDYIDITLELRDLLQNRLQPVMAIPNNKVIPPFTFVFDIY